jgi:cation transport ATPase
MHCWRFVERVFRLEEVRSISVDRSQATAVVRSGKNAPNPAAFLRRLSLAIQDDESKEGRIGAPTGPLPRGVREARWTIHRHEGILSTVEVLTDRPGWLRIRHETLRRDLSLARKAESLLATVPGVKQAILGGWSGSLMIQYNAASVSSRQLIRLAEDALDSSGWWGRTLPPPPRSSFMLANTTLAVAALTDLVMPLLAPLSALLLIGTNFRTFRVAAREVAHRKLGLPVLYTVIVAGTLVSGQFLASALMSWSFRFWHGRLRRELSAERRRWLDECLPLPHLARLVTAEGHEVLVPVDRLRPGDRVLVSTDEGVPSDGRVIEGDGFVDEGIVRGVIGASRRRQGDTVLAGSRVLAGSLRIEVSRGVGDTRASTIGQALLSATTHRPGPLAPTEHAAAFADGTVAPTLATAGFALLVGDLTTFLAILRPDYATGPSVAMPLETLRLAALCARQGIVARTPDAFDRLAQVDLLVIEDSPRLWSRRLNVVQVQTHLPENLLLRYAASAFRHMADDRAEALADGCRERGGHLLDLPVAEYESGVTVIHAGHRIRVREQGTTGDGAGPLLVEIDGTAVGLIEFAWSSTPVATRAMERLRGIPGVSVVVVSDRTGPELAATAEALDARAHLGRLSTDDRAQFLRECRARGLHTAYLGDCSRHAAAAAEAHVSIAMEPKHDVKESAADVVLLSPSLDQFIEVWLGARALATRTRSTQRLILLPNLLCVAGAFLLGTTALTAVVVSNLSTLGLYHRSAHSLRALQVAHSGRRSRPRLDSR